MAVGCVSSSLTVGTIYRNKFLACFSNKKRRLPLFFGVKREMLSNYFPILLFVIVGLLVGVVPILLGRLISPNRPDPENFLHMSVVLRHLKMHV